MSGKAEAILEIVRDSRNRKISTASAKRVVKACRVLGLADDEIRQVMSAMDYCDNATGAPYSKFVTQVWP